jgi:hypothetical protein
LVQKGALLCNNYHREIIELQNLQEDKNTGKYVCNKCHKDSSGFIKLVQHIARHHANDGNYQAGVGYVCCVCGVVFGVPIDLEDHMVTHGTI